MVKTTLNNSTLPFPAMPSTATIKGIVALSEDTSLFRLSFADEIMSKKFTFTPGQFVQFSVPGGGEIPISLTGSPRKGEEVELCIRRVGHVTSMVHRLKSGDQVALRGPFGTGFPVDRWAGSNVLLLAGGLGIAPLRSLLLYLVEHRALYKDITFMYGARQPASLLFRDELAQLACRGSFRLLVTVDLLEGEPPQDIVCRTGLLPELLTAYDIPSGSTVAAICGPPALYRCVIGELGKFGIGSDDIYISLERRMKCGNGLCCHCAVGDLFCCTDGPVFRYSRLQHLQEAL